MMMKKETLNSDNNNNIINNNGKSQTICLFVYLRYRRYWCLRRKWFLLLLYGITCEGQKVPAVVLLRLEKKINVYSHLHTHIQHTSHHWCCRCHRLPSFFLSFFLAFPTILDHGKTTRSENDRSHVVLSFLFCVKLDGVEHCMWLLDEKRSPGN